MIAHPTRSRARVPMRIEPMLATLTDQREFSGPRGKWIFERKLDGFRALGVRSGTSVQLTSRTHQDFAQRYPEIARALEHQPLSDFAVDGEIVAFADGQVSFQQLQQSLRPSSFAHARRTRVRIAYYVFDLLFAAGHDLRELPLRERKRLLKQFISFNDVIRMTPHRVGSGPELYQEACRQGWEGLIAKDADAPYIGRRTRHWLKLKCQQRQEFVIGGYTDPQGSRSVLGALLVGYHERGKLLYAGKVGTGFSQATLKMFQKLFTRIKSNNSPFSPSSDLPRKGMHWVKPKLVCEVEFSEWTRDGKLRHPQFIGLREDKRPEAVVREHPARP